jgi:competence ComEA-like helix-hairpin-helix protein
VATTPQERLALGVATLLLAAGVAARALAGGPPAPELTAASEPTLASLTDAVRDSAARAARRRAPLGEGERIDPNTAPVDELSRLPRVGPALAARIVAWREAHGPFRSLVELDAVPGVGPAVLREAGPHIALPAPPRVSVAASPSRSAPGPGPVDVNRASVTELTALPGIGPALAERIVAAREEDGRFRSVDDLLRVSGIGPAKLERLRGAVLVTP